MQSDDEYSDLYDPQHWDCESDCTSDCGSDCTNESDGDGDLVLDTYDYIFSQLDERAAHNYLELSYFTYVKNLGQDSSCLFVEEYLDRGLIKRNKSSKIIRDLAAWESQYLEASDICRRSNRKYQWRLVEAMSASTKKIKDEESASDLEAVLPLIRTVARPTTLRQAWEQNNHEAVVSLASDLIEQRASATAHHNIDGIRELCAALRHRFLAYEAMSLSSLAVSDAKRILELTGKFGGDVDVEVDDQLLPVLAPLDTIIGPETIVPSDGQDLQRGLKRPADDALGGKLVKRTKAGKRSLIRKSSLIVRLPVEVMLLIADHLSASDRIKLANTRYDWRNIPELWRSLEFVRVKNITPKGWQRDTIDACISAIQTCQRRSHNNLSLVVLKGFVSSVAVGPILEALQTSSATLRHLAIPTADQAQCLSQLYKRSHGLTGIDIRIDVEPRDAGSSHTSSLFSIARMPFKLKTFISTQSIDCGDIAAHMKGLEVVQGVKISRQKQLNFIEGLVRAAPTLIEWRDNVDDRWDFTTVVLGDYGAGREQLPKKPIVFPKLRKLHALWAEHFIECIFPVLEEAHLNSLRGISTLSPANSNDQFRIAAVILKSPLLKKLDIMLPTSTSELRQIYKAISTLPDLEELGLWWTGQVSLQYFLDAQKAGDDSETFLILPKLHTLRLCPRSTSAAPQMDRDLTQLLLYRFFLKKGCKFGDAHARVEAALLAYGVYGYPGPTKAQRKKMINTAASDAAKSSYKGDFSTIDGVKRENFTPVLPNLVVTRNSLKVVSDSPDTLLRSLIDRVVELDTSKHFEGHSGHVVGGRHYY